MNLPATVTDLYCFPQVNRNPRSGSGVALTRASRRPGGYY